MHSSPQIGHFGIRANNDPSFSNLYAAPMGIIIVRDQNSEGLMIHFNLSNSKGKNSDPLPNLIDLPELPTVNINPVSILKKLKEGSTIWAWYKIMDFKVKRESVS